MDMDGLNGLDWMKRKYSIIFWFSIKSMDVLPLCGWIGAWMGCMFGSNLYFINKTPLLSRRFGSNHSAILIGCAMGSLIGFLIQHLWIWIFSHVVFGYRLGALIKYSLMGSILCGFGAFALIDTIALLHLIWKNRGNQPFSKLPKRVYKNIDLCWVNSMTVGQTVQQIQFKLGAIVGITFWIVLHLVIMRSSMCPYVENYLWGWTCW